MDYIIDAIKKIIWTILLIVCVVIVVLGHRDVGYFGLLKQLLGLSGILLLVYFYNRPKRG